MPTRRVSYRNENIAVTFMVDEEGKTTATKIEPLNGNNPFSEQGMASVPFDELAEFARKHGNLTVTTEEPKKRGRKAAEDKAQPVQGEAPKW